VALEKTRVVSRHRRCPICDRADWCLVATSGAYAICRRVESSRPAQGALGGWVHRLDGGTPRGAYQPAPKATRAPSNCHIAPLERRDRVYRRLLAAAALGDEQRDALRRRGFSDEEIARRGYGYLPNGRFRWVTARDLCGGNVGELVGVPGFYEKPAGKNPYWTITGLAGQLIPARDPAGLIRGLRVRPDDQSGGGKYRWLSSGNKPGGAGSGVHCHVSRPLTRKAAADELWITEGEFKADLASERLGAVVVSVPGVGSWAKALADLAVLLPGGGRVVLALDLEWATNGSVHAAFWGLKQACAALGYEVGVATWPDVKMKLDDLLTTGGTPEIRPAAVIPEPAWPMKLSSRIMADGPPRRAIPSVTLAAMRRILITGLIAAPSGLTAARCQSALSPRRPAPARRTRRRRPWRRLESGRAGSPTARRTSRRW
jgi:hypothetical protein